MKVAAWLLTACIALAALKAAVTGLFIALAITLLWAAATKPRETTSMIVALAAASVVTAYPLTALLALTAAASARIFFCKAH